MALSRRFSVLAGLRFLLKRLNSVHLIVMFLQQIVNSADGSKPEKGLANSKQNPWQPQQIRHTLYPSMT
jgi:hypothetical protein